MYGGGQTLGRPAAGSRQHCRLEGSTQAPRGKQRCGTVTANVPARRARNKGCRRRCRARPLACGRRAALRAPLCWGLGCPGRPAIVCVESRHKCVCTGGSMAGSPSRQQERHRPPAPLGSRCRAAAAAWRSAAGPAAGCAGGLPPGSPAPPSLRHGGIDGRQRGGGGRRGWKLCKAARRAPQTEQVQSMHARGEPESHPPSISLLCVSGTTSRHKPLS